MDFSSRLVMRFKDDLAEVSFIDVHALELELGRSFPQDYLRVMQDLPQFSLDEYIGIMGPEGVVHSRAFDQENFSSAFRGREGFYIDGGYGHVSVVEQGEFIPFTDLLKFGSTSTSTSMYWHMSAVESEGWPVVVGSQGVWYKYDATFSEFLYGLLHGSISCPLLVDEDWPGEEFEVAVWR